MTLDGKDNSNVLLVNPGSALERSMLDPFAVHIERDGLSTDPALNTDQAVLEVYRVRNQRVVGQLLELASRRRR